MVYEREIIKRIKDRAKTLRIDLEIPDNIDYEDILEISRELHIDYLRLLSPNYKKLEILCFNKLDDDARKIINTAEEIVHILYEYDKDVFYETRFNRLLLNPEVDFFSVLKIGKVFLIVETIKKSPIAYNDSLNKRIEENIGIFSKKNIENMRKILYFRGER